MHGFVVPDWYDRTEVVEAVRDMGCGYEIKGRTIYVNDDDIWETIRTAMDSAGINYIVV